MNKIGQGAATDSIILVLVKIIVVIISLVIYKLLTVKFSLNEYGVYAQTLVIVNTVIGLTVLGMTDAVNYFFNKDLGGNIGKIYAQTIFFMQCIVGLIGAILMFVLKKEIANYFNTPDLENYIVYIILIPVLTNLLNFYQILFVSYKKGKLIACRNLIYSLFKVCVVILACYVWHSVKLVLIGSLIADMLVVGYMCYYCNTHFFEFKISNFKLGLIKEILIYSIPMATFIFTNSMSRNIDKLVIGWFGNSQEMALYAIGSKELPFDMFTASFITVLIPYITRFISANYNKKASATFSYYIQISYIIIWILACGAIISSKELMLVLYDQKYIAALNVFCIYIVVDMLRFANMSLVFSAKGKTVELIVYSFGALIVNTFMNIALYKFFGMEGPAVATVIITGLMAMVMLIRSSVLLECDVKDLINFKQALLLLGECLVFGTLAYMLKATYFYKFNPLLSLFLTSSIYMMPLLLLNFRRILEILKSINALKLELD